jgi:cbb3-type cytochrome oxidase subunit 3
VLALSRVMVLSLWLRLLLPSGLLSGRLTLLLLPAVLLLIVVFAHRSRGKEEQKEQSRAPIPPVAKNDRQAAELTPCPQGAPAMSAAIRDS